MEQDTEPKEAVEMLDYATIRDNFYDELTKAARGESTSLPFIHNQLPSASLVQAGETFQVFVIGGTNGETATALYNSDGSVSITDYQAHPELSKFHTLEDFLAFIDSHVADTTKAIGLNFAFTLIPQTGDKGQLDGVMVSGDTKGHAFQGLQQERVGEAIERHFQQTHRRDLLASVGNDTVCLIASGTNRDTDRDTLVAGIVGTGYNMAFYLDNQTIINVQASDFTSFTPTATGRVVDHESKNVGEQLYNKEVAAGELYKHYNALLEEHHLSSGILQSTKELAVLAKTHKGKEGDIARSLFRRSASLVAAQFAGFYNFKERPPTLTAIMQDGLFWEGPRYKEMVNEELAQLGVPEGAIRFEKVVQSDVLGAAKLITGGL
jgi:hexokinase